MGGTPHKGHYYLNLEVLKEKWRLSEGLQEGRYNYPEDANRPPFFIAQFEPSTHDDAQETTRLLIETELRVYPDWMFRDLIKIPKLPVSASKEYTLKVNNVEQGNWNVILADDKPCLMYDIGTNAYGSSVSQDIQRQLRNHPFTNDVEALFISHWHADHFNILTGMNAAELKRIKQFVCTTSLNCLTEFNILLWFRLHRSTQICMVNHPAKEKWQSVPLVSGHLNMYVRRYVKSNPNNAGLLLFFKGMSDCVTLTGDANYSTIQEVSKDGISKLNCKGGYNMIAPHHGGHAGSFTCSVDDVIKKEAIISVGANNPYHHPDKQVERRLKQSFLQVSKTSEEGDVTMSL